MTSDQILQGLLDLAEELDNAGAMESANIAQGLAHALEEYFICYGKSDKQPPAGTMKVIHVEPPDPAVPLTICDECKWHVCEFISMKAGIVYLCTHHELLRKRDVVNGGHVGRKYNLCRDVNTSGTCPWYERGQPPIPTWLLDTPPVACHPLTLLWRRLTALFTR